MKGKAPNPKRAEALEMFRAGATNTEVCEELNLTPSQVANWKTHLKAKGLLPDVERSNSKPMTVSELWKLHGGPTGYTLCGEARPSLVTVTA